MQLTLVTNKLAWFHYSSLLHLVLSNTTAYFRSFLQDTCRVSARLAAAVAVDSEVAAVAEVSLRQVLAFPELVGVSRDLT